MHDKHHLICSRLLYPVPGPQAVAGVPQWDSLILRILAYMYTIIKGSYIQSTIRFAMAHTSCAIRTHFKMQICAIPIS